MGKPIKLATMAAGLFLAFFLVWTILPFIIMFVSSFKDLLEAFNLPEKGAWGQVIPVFFDFEPTLKHYEELFTERNFTTYFFNSVVASLGSALISVTLGAMAVARGEAAGKGAR